MGVTSGDGVDVVEDAVESYGVSSEKDATLEKGFKA
jgi:hypothetical protein